jgi:ankyrin repeat protein
MKEADERLLAATTQGRFEEVEQLLNQGADPNVKGDLDERPLHLAARRGNEALVRRLITAGARVDARTKDGFTPLHLVVTEEPRAHLDISGLLIEAGASVEAKQKKTAWSMLHWAAFHGNARLAKLLLDAGADPDEQENKDRWTPLHLVRTAETAQVLFRAGANIDVRDKKQKTPLLTAIATPTSDRPEAEIASVVATLVDNGAEVNVSAGRDRTSVHAAIDVRIPKVVAKLVEKGADLTASNRDHGTPLHHACLVGEVGMVDVLLEAGAPVNSTDGPGGATPLHLAAVYGHTEIVEKLLPAGADVNTSDRKGKRPVDYARDDETRQVLLDAE